MKTEYQLQPLPVRAFRWLRYMPFAYARGVFYIGWWVLLGMPVTDADNCFGRRYTRMEVLETAWRSHISSGYWRMGHSWTVEQFLERLK